ncbi:serine/threonine-protein phosphatase [Sphingobacterium sp.]|uniref:PP2C family protein-serine/threonine phosphatase n=1 Tax=Sphingobacterium sp. TaxID=341027 RepID=UPI00289F5BB6|nr:serine/threonine-protein phosphatase [Sphingobacterium sp.]
MKYIAYSHIGKRKSNEDAVLVKELHPNSLFAIIADGMGGYEYGDKAAELIIGNLLTYLSALNNNSYSKNDIENAIKKANLAIKHFNDKKNVKSGATMAGAIINNETTLIFWVGDVQVDLFKGGELVYKTQPHTLIQDLKKQLDVVPIEMIQKYNHVVTKSISGKREVIDFGYQEFKNTDYDILIISSDGVHNCINTSQLLNKVLIEINEILELNAYDNNSYIILKK